MIIIVTPIRYLQFYFRKICLYNHPLLLRVKKYENLQPIFVVVVETYE